MSLQKSGWRGNHAFCGWIPPRTAFPAGVSSRDRLGPTRLLIAGPLALLVSGRPLPASSGQDAAVRFENVTSGSGLTFVLQQHATPDKHMVETMAGGLAVFDYDGDGRPDIFFTNGAALPSLSKETPADWNRLYPQRRRLQFHAT